MHESVFDLPVAERIKAEIVEKIGEAEFRIVEGSNERIQIEALIAHIAILGRM